MRRTLHSHYSRRFPTRKSGLDERNQQSNLFRTTLVGCITILAIMASHDIAGLTRQCQASIAELNDHALDREMSDWLLYQVSSLNIWIDALGVYAEHELSVAYRLVNNQPLATKICQQLQALRGNFTMLQRAILKERAAVNNVCPQDAAQDDSGETPASNSSSDDHGGIHNDGASDENSDADETESDEASDDDSEGDVARHQRDIEDRLDLMTFAATTVRRQSKDHLRARAQDHDPVDDDGERLEPEFLSFADHIIRRAFNIPQKYAEGVTAPAAYTDASTELGPDLQPYRIPE
jgi:hypothetical protein